MNLEIRLLDARLEDDDLFPRYATPEAAAVDLRACNLNGAEFLRSQFTLRPGERISLDGEVVGGSSTRTTRAKSPWRYGTAASTNTSCARSTVLLNCSSRRSCARNSVS